MDNSKNNNPLSALEKRLHFQSLLAELSAKFVRVPADTIDQEINDSLRRIAENLDIDHIGLGLITADSNPLGGQILRHERYRCTAARMV
jgi:hypothetical protein